MGCDGLRLASVPARRKMRMPEAVSHDERVGTVDPYTIIIEPTFVARFLLNPQKGHQHRGAVGCPFRQTPHHDVGGSAGLARCG
jgi:hypothetical protein